MKENCLDIGIVQAFMDGELPQDQIARVSDHLERCDSCAFMLGEAEDEASLVFSALDRELNTLVPTQRLWNKISGSIEVQWDSRPFWKKAQAFLGAAFASPSMIGAAGLLIAVGAFSLILLNREPVSEDLVSLPRPDAVTAPSAQAVREETPVILENVNAFTKVDRIDDPRRRMQRALYRPRTAPAVALRSDRSSPVSATGYMEGEESYLKTISSLARTIEEQKDAVLRPSERVAYERDMAVVNDTIARMRQEVKRNPRNETAKQVLYSSYQIKIDLLNSVSQKEELVASLHQ
jgi:hypothetical protein